MTQLFSCDTEWRTRHTTCQQINLTGKSNSTVLAHIIAYDVPMRTVQLQTCAIVILIFNKFEMTETSHLKPKRLAAGTCTYLV